MSWVPSNGKFPATTISLGNIRDGFDYVNNTTTTGPVSITSLANNTLYYIDGSTYTLRSIISNPISLSDFQNRYYRDPRPKYFYITTIGQNIYNINQFITAPFKYFTLTAISGGGGGGGAGGGYSSYSPQYNGGPGGGGGSGSMYISENIDYTTNDQPFIANVGNGGGGGGGNGAGGTGGGNGSGGGDGGPTIFSVNINGNIIIGLTNGGNKGGGGNGAYWAYELARPNYGAPGGGGPGGTPGHGFGVRISGNGGTSGASATSGTGQGAGIGGNGIYSLNTTYGRGGNGGTTQYGQGGPGGSGNGGYQGAVVLSIYFV